LSLVGAALLSTLAPAVARADAVADAKDLFARARDMRGQGDCASAIPLFRKAYEIYPAGLGSLRNTAECEESVGHFASSRRAWLDLKRALITVDDRKYDGWGHDADEAATRLAPKLATLTVDIATVAAGGVSAPSDGVEVRLNGELLAPGLLGTQLERDPGKYVVSVGGPRVGAAQERVVLLAAGEAQRVALRVAVKALGETGRVEGAVATGPGSASSLTAGASGSASTTAPGVGAEPASTRESDDERRAATRRTAAWVAFGVGAAGIVGTVASVVARQEAFTDLQHDGCNSANNGYICNPTADPSTVRHTLDRGNTASTSFNVFLTVGIVGAATGVVLLATSHPHGAGAALVLSPTGAWAVGKF
jgi:hypothetical protein